MKVALYRTKRKGKSWAVRWYGRPDLTGKRRRYSRAFARRTEAESFQAKKRMELDGGVSPDGQQTVTLGRFLAGWLDLRRQSKLQPATIKLYGHTIDRLIGYFGRDALLSGITAEKVEWFLVEQKNRSGDTRKGNDLSSATLDQIRRNAKAIFNYAVRTDRLLKNPFRDVDVRPVCSKAFHKWTPAEFLALLRVVDLRRQCLYALAFLTGARRTALFALRWTDIDFERKILNITNRPATADLPPFTAKGKRNRRIPLPPDFMLPLLTKWHAAAPVGVPYVLLTAERFKAVQKHWRLLVKENGGQPQKAGKFWLCKFWENNALRDFKEHCRKAGVKDVEGLPITLHGLRKMYGDNITSIAGLPVAQKLLGHSDIRITLEHYTNVDEPLERQAADGLDKLIKSGEENHTKLGTNDLQKSDAGLTFSGISGDKILKS